MKAKKIILCVVMAGALSGCVFTKVVSVPMRVGAAVVSVIPGVGNKTHDAIDGAAETVDDIPI
ncbi:hypothetical protein JCM14076_16480 [Methylosoma difficile]